MRQHYTYLLSDWQETCTFWCAAEFYWLVCVCRETEKVENRCARGTSLSSHGLSQVRGEGAVTAVRVSHGIWPLRASSYPFQSCYACNAGAMVKKGGSAVIRPHTTSVTSDKRVKPVFPHLQNGNVRVVLRLKKGNTCKALRMNRWHIGSPNKCQLLLILLKTWR